MAVLVDMGAGPVGRTVALVLAQDESPPPDKGDEFGKASPIGLVVILLLGIAVIFLIRSMTKHLRRIPASFDTAPPAPFDTAPPAPFDTAPSAVDPDSRSPAPVDPAPGTAHGIPPDRGSPRAGDVEAPADS